jgi:hypothetical protein
MAMQEIQSTDWKTFCERFARLHRGDLMTLFHIHPSGYQQEIFRDLPLQKVSFDQSDPCNDRILLTFQADRTREITHEVVEPIHVKLREEGQGNKGLQIDAENGSTILRFSSGKFEQLLEGLGSNSSLLTSAPTKN